MLRAKNMVYDDGTGTIAFHDDGSFTWHENQSETGEELVFGWISAAADSSIYTENP